MKNTPVKVSASEAVSVVKSNDNVYFSCFGCTPDVLIDELCIYAKDKNLHDVNLYHTITMCNAKYSSADYNGIFKVRTLFVAGNTRKHVASGDAGYIPIALNETSNFFRNGHVPLDVAFIAVSPVDEHGYVSLGLSVDMTLAALQSAKIVVAVVNENIPRTFGDALIPFNTIDIYVESHKEICEVVYPEPTEIEKVIGKYCAELVDNGSCLQLGIGTIPNAILSLLDNHEHLGIHSEMFSDGVIPLVEKGVIDGKFKKIDQGKLVSCFLMGSHKLHKFVNDNPLIVMKETAYTNDPFVIAQNPNVVAVNSAIEIDITGQICADSIGETVYSGVGGQLDFVYGANRSQGGRSVFALSSLTSKGGSKIVPRLTNNAPVVTPRSMVHHVVTEHGRVDLYGKTLQERAKLLISIADPSAREELEKAAYERFGGEKYLKW